MGGGAWAPGPAWVREASWRLGGRWPGGPHLLKHDSFHSFSWFVCFSRNDGLQGSGGSPGASWSGASGDTVYAPPPPPFLLFSWGLQG